MLCQFERLLYPKDKNAVDISSYIIALYRPCMTVYDAQGMKIPQFKAVGYCLPIAERMRFDLHGHWSKTEKHGLQFNVESYDEVIVHSKEGIIAYLSSGQIKGIGEKLAERIHKEFGDLSLEILDKEPDRLLTIPGISVSKLSKIKDSYLMNRGARDVVAFLTPYGITPNKAVKFYMAYGKDAMQIVKEHPYKLCELSGIGFLTADKIAMSMGFERLSVERVDAGLLYTLTEAEGHGHLCLEKHDFIKACVKLLDTPNLTEEMVANRAAWMVHDG